MSLSSAQQLQEPAKLHLRDESSLPSPTLDHDDNSDSGSDSQDADLSAQSTGEDNRCKQSVLFEAWATDTMLQISNKEMEIPLMTEVEEEISLKTIMAKHEKSKRIIASPRDYQMELFERAKTENTIAVLDTGSGKTLIAVLLLRHILEQELERRAAGCSARTAFFLVEKVMLCQQQYAVLSANIDFKVIQVHGSMLNGVWDKIAWRQNFEENMVIVCTAEVLFSCLVHSFIKMSDINLLIFDEAHHAKKGHPYARIIRDFYLAESNPERRPRIFGTTASPIDIVVNDSEIARSQAQELEELLHAKIATPSDPKALQAFVHRPEEIVLPFHPPKSAPSGELTKMLQEKCGFLKEFSRLSTASEIHAQELGSWCGEAFWSLAFSAQKAKRLAAFADQRFATQNLECHRRMPSENAAGQAEHDREVKALNEARQRITDHILETPTAQNASPKVITLYNLLFRQFRNSENSRVLVFVERRSTAMLLDTYFSKVQPPLRNFKCGFLVGHVRGDSSFGDTSKNQATLLMNFRKGNVNCIFATSAAEEGLDIQDCNVVVRFDPVKTMIQYIQSRGRARHRQSKLFHMIENGNKPMLTQVSQVTLSAKAMSDFSTLLPPDRILRGFDDDYDDQTKHRYTKLPALLLPQGAKLTFDFALVVLAHFAASVPHEPEDDMSVNYVMKRTSGGFRCEVILPSASPIKSVTGSQYPRKALAKRSAAFEACRLLLRDQYLDENLLPIYTRRLPALRNARLAVKNDTSIAYDVLLKPRMWNENREQTGSDYYLTLIQLEGQWQIPTSPLGLLTRQRLPDFPSFPIFRTDGSACQVLIHTFREAVLITDHISTLTGFTLRVFNDVFNKSFERNDRQMPYWLAPLRPFTIPQLSQLPSGDCLIDWNLAYEIDSKSSKSWYDGMPYEELVHKFLIDPFHGGRRYFSKAIHPTLKPMDAFPTDGFKHSSKVENIIDNSVSLFKKSAGKFTWNKVQPVIVAEMGSHRLNVLAAPSEQEASAKTKTYVCPELLKISLLPVDTVAMTMVFPGIISRLEAYLVALELRDSLSLEISPAIMLEALTKDSDNLDDDDQEKINFQRGMGPNYERLEFIGDTFLKMSTTIAIFARHSAKDEFQMHVDRMLMICNANLMKHAKRRGHHAYIRGQAFSRRTWYPELKLIKGKAVGKDSNQLRLGDKTIADVCEAIIGGALISNYCATAPDHARFDNAVRAVSIFVQDANHQMLKWQDYADLFRQHAPNYIAEIPTAAQRVSAQTLADEHPYKFKSARLARSAFSHSSFPRSWEPGIPSYERLEFLGDALLDMASVLYLWTSFSEKRDPQWLTEHKMAMASNKFLGVLCVKLGFYKHIRHAHASFEGTILQYVTEVNEIQAEHGHERNYWTLAKEPPKFLADVVEAYVGAMFIDSGFKFGEVQRFFDMHIKWFFEDVNIYDTFANNHPIMKLQHYMKDTVGCSDYRLMAQEMPTSDGMDTKALAGLMIHSQIVSRGHASTVKSAKTLAANTFLRRDADITPGEFRQKFQCTCKLQDSTVKMI